MQAASPQVVYRDRLDRRRAELRSLRRADFRLSAVRMAIFLAGALLAWPALMSRTIAWGWLLIPIGAFFAAARIHDRLIRRRIEAGRAVDFYEAGLARLEDRWAGRGVGGERFLDPDHPYAGDLDLFGEGSLFELLCTARTRVGERTLARWLLAPASPEQIRARQQAVAELRDALDLREDLARLGEDVRAGEDPDALVAWATTPAGLPASRGPLLWAALAGAANVAALVAWLTSATGLLPLFVTGTLAALVAAGYRARVRRVLAGATRQQGELRLLAQLLDRIERERFDAPLLKELCAGLEVDGRSPSRSVASLSRLVEMHESRGNMIFAPIAALLLLGTQLAFAMERWRRRSGAAVPQWLEIAGRFEALSSLAARAYERPQEIFPEIVDGAPQFAGEALGHPLLAESACVTNDLQLGEPARLLLVSGSNMSGKSTLLRTLGVHAVLAQAGGTVRARRLRLSPLAVGASLNVRDSLQAGSSHFYAEIKRLRQLMDLGGEGRPLFFLLDEILHGTNSHDRRIGAAALIRELLDRGAIGLVTTHDLALAEVAEGLAPAARNVHFEDHVREGRLAFDYRLKPGVVRKSNALELMRSVGLDV